ncbi:hypothetical protein J6590_064618 [Homalodisca vitripennis]|nr:hypothetical protein J6590_064618 [Homalodisca vitripennis]
MINEEEFNEITVEIKVLVFVVTITKHRQSALRAVNDFVTQYEYPREAEIFPSTSSSRVCSMGRSCQVVRKSGDGGAPPAN